MPLRSAYIHIPFCRHRCGYCNFSLIAGRDHLVDRFLRALEVEICQLPESAELDTLFFGGGTPSHLGAEQLKRLAAIVDQRFTLAPNAEVSAECNPSDIDREKLQALLKLGVNRISLGVQSLNADKLKRLERDHSPDAAARAVELAKAEVGNVSMDLIFAAPQETYQQWQTDLANALALRPDHLSTYELTYEKGTQFWNRLQRGGLAVADEDLRADMYEHAIEQLDRGGQTGWQQYELSSFATDGHQCRHNQSYWNGSDYLAFGPGASRFVDGVRSTNHQSTLTYMKRLEAGQSPIAQTEQLTGLAAARERLVVGMRLLRGVNLAELEAMTGVALDRTLPLATRELLIQSDLIEIADGVCRLTRRGVMVSDGVAETIL